MDLCTTDDRIRHLVAHSAGISRSDVATVLSLPAPTVTSAVRRLLADGSVVERESRGTRTVAGRRPRLLFRSGPQPCIGVVECSRAGMTATVADYTGRRLQTRRLPARAAGAPLRPDSAVATLCRTAATLRPRQELNAVVISVPAPVQRRPHPARKDPPPHWGPPLGPRPETVTEADLAEALTDRFGTVVYVENDANLAALGEFSAGAGRGGQDQVYLLFDRERVGTGLILDNRLVRGATGYAGELAHVRVADDGPICECGGRGCLTYRLGSGPLASTHVANTPPMTFADLLRTAGQGDARAAEVLADVGRVVGRPLADLCTVLDPGVIVVDGRLGCAAQHVVSGIREQIEQFTPPAISAATTVVAGTLGDNVAVHGAIELARATCGQSPSSTSRVSAIARLARGNPA
jgi:predicted NBD/HSP70 family sugar kinase